MSTDIVHSKLMNLISRLFGNSISVKSRHSPITQTVLGVSGSSETMKPSADNYCCARIRVVRRQFPISKRSPVAGV